MALHNILFLPAVISCSSFLFPSLFLRLTSPSIFSSSPFSCIVFWYFLYLRLTHPVRVSISYLSLLSLSPKSIISYFQIVFILPKIFSTLFGRTKSQELAIYPWRMAIMSSMWALHSCYVLVLLLPFFSLVSYA